MQIPSEMLMLTNEPAILAFNGKLSFANAAARRIIGDDCVGKSLESVLGAEIANMQSSSFIADIPVFGEPYLVRTSVQDGTRAVFFSKPNTEPMVLNDAFINAINSCLMNMGMSGDLCRERAEALGDEKLLRYLCAMDRNYYRISRVMNNISVLRAVHDGALPVENQITDLSKLCTELVEALAELRDDNVLRLNVEPGIMVRSGSDMMALMLSNLISNCLTHAHGLSRVSVNLSSFGDSALLSVSDDGCGIEPEELTTVFSRYRYRSDPLQAGRGAGLGLAVVCRIAERYGGTLLLESRVERGTTVRVSVKKLSGAATPLQTPQQPYVNGTRSLLTLFADCLPDEAFDVRHMD